MLANRRRRQDLNLRAEARESVRGGLLVLKGEGELPPAMLVGRRGGAYGFSGRFAEYLGERGKRLG
jgi:hypothetical protein